MFSFSATASDRLTGMGRAQRLAPVEVGSRPGCLARAKCAFYVERSKIAFKSRFRKGVREPNFFESDSKARAFARAAHAGARGTAGDEWRKDVFPAEPRRICWSRANQEAYMLRSLAIICCALVVSPWLQGDQPKSEPLLRLTLAGMLIIGTNRKSCR